MSAEWGPAAEGEIIGVASVVLGGYVNGYGVVRSLVECALKTQIIVIDDRISCAAKSKYVNQFYKIADFGDLQTVLEEISAKFDLVVVYATSDEHMIELASLKSSGKLPAEIYFPFGARRVEEILQKDFQADIAKKAGMLVPGTRVAFSLDELRQTLRAGTSILVKPISSERVSRGIFRAALLADLEDLDIHGQMLAEALRVDKKLLVSEFVPGPESSIYAYTCYLSPDGKVVQEWCGRKLSQFPDQFGVFSTAIFEVNDEVASLGRRAVKLLGQPGLCQVEMKKSSSTGEYYFIEFSLRSDMWHRVGALAGVNLPAALLSDAIGLKRRAPSNSTAKSGPALVYLWHEVGNLLGRRGYWPDFVKNVLAKSVDRRFVFSIIDDPVPAIVSWRIGYKILGRSLQRRLGSLCSVESWRSHR